MKVTYEATDAAMTYAPVMEAVSPWPISFTNGPGSGRGGPSTTHADTGTNSALRRANTVDASVNVKFYGISCTVTGFATGVGLLIELDNKTITPTVPLNKDVLFALDSLEQTLHDLTITITSNTTASSLNIQRFEYDTGLPDTMELAGSYAADSDVWVLQGDWEHRTLDTEGTLHSLLSRKRWEQAALTGALSGPSLLFLYANTGPDYGLTQISWTENTTVPSGDDLWKVYWGESPVALRGVLAYVGYVPPEGWTNWFITNLDGQVNGRLVEFTRLDIWKVPPETIVSNTISSSATETAGAKETSTSSGTPVAAIGGGVAAGVIAIIVGVLVFFFLRRRRRIQEEAATASSLRPFPGDAERRFTDTPAAYPSITPYSPPLTTSTNEKHVFISQKTNPYTDTTSSSATSSPAAMTRNLEDKPAMQLFARDRERDRDTKAQIVTRNVEDKPAMRLFARDRDRKAPIVLSAESEAASSSGAGSVSGDASGSSREGGSAQTAPAIVPGVVETLPPAYTPRRPLQR